MLSCTVPALETHLLHLQNESLLQILPETSLRESFQKGKINRKIRTCWETRSAVPTSFPVPPDGRSLQPVSFSVYYRWSENSKTNSH